MGDVVAGFGGHLPGDDGDEAVLADVGFVDAGVVYAFVLDRG